MQSLINISGKCKHLLGMPIYAAFCILCFISAYYYSSLLYTSKCIKCGEVKLTTNDS